MEIIQLLLLSAIVVISIVQVVRGAGQRKDMAKVLPFIYLVEAVAVVCPIIMKTADIHLILLSVYLMTFPLMSMSFSRLFKSVGLVVMLSGGVLMSYHLIQSAGSVSILSPTVDVLIVLLSSLLYLVAYAVDIWMSLRDVEYVLKSSTPWYMILVSSNSVYSLVMLFVSVLVTAALLTDDVISMVFTILSFIIIVLLQIVLPVRSVRDSAFFFMRRHEKVILESMNGHNEMEHDDIYKTIYDRVLRIFEEDKPYLNGDLAITDLVSMVFTNKYYLSKSISMHSGRNFCQFVNHFRIMYAVEKFRENTSLKVSELWPMCGFNSIVSFNMAFHLFMNENPSEWCRKERVRLANKRK